MSDEDSIKSTSGGSQVLSYLYIGSRFDAKNLGWLKSHDIRYVLNCTPSKELDPLTGCPNYYKNDKSFHYKRIPVFDNKGEDMTQHFDTAFKFIEASRHHGSILVHCHKGISRSATFVIGYLMKSNDFTRDEALLYLQNIRPIIQPNAEFLDQLSEYEKKLEGERSRALERGKASARCDIGPSIQTAEESILGKRIHEDV